MAVLFRRSASLSVIDGTGVSVATGTSGAGNNTLKFLFTCHKSLTRQANSCEISIFNLSQDSRAAFERLDEDVTLSLQAGYGDDLNQIFSGNRGVVRNVNDTASSEWVTTISLGDAATKLRKRLARISIGGPSSVDKAAMQLSSALGVAVTQKTAEKIRVASSGPDGQLTRGYSFSGRADMGLSDALQKIGLNASIQDGELQVLAVNETNPDQREVRKYSPGSGLIGSPEAGDRGIVRIRVLLDGRIRPGDRFELESRRYNEGSPFKALSVAHVGDTYGESWFTDIEGLPLEQ